MSRWPIKLKGKHFDVEGLPGYWGDSLEVYHYNKAKECVGKNKIYFPEKPAGYLNTPTGHIHASKIVLDVFNRLEKDKEFTMNKSTKKEAQPECKPPEQYPIPDSHAELFRIFYGAFSQSAFGKGQERHGQKKPFKDQPLLQIVDMLGANGTGFTVGQAIKKLQEANRMDPAKAIHEMRGAMVYIAGTILALEKQLPSVPESSNVSS